MRISTMLQIMCAAAVLLLMCACQKTEHLSGGAENNNILMTSQMISEVSSQFLLSDKAQSTTGHSESTLEFAKSGANVVYIEPVNSGRRVVHGGKAGKSYSSIGDMNISPDGKRVAYTGRYNDTFTRIVVDNWEGPLFNDIVVNNFSPDSKHHLYVAEQNGNTLLVVDNKIHKEFINVQNPTVSSDSSSVAFSSKTSDGKQQFVIGDLLLQNKEVFNSCGSSVTASSDKSRLAVSCSEGETPSIKIIDFATRKVVSSQPITGTMLKMTIAPDNRSVAYIFVKQAGGINFIGYNDKVEQIPTGEVALSAPLVLSSPDGVGVIIGGAYNARLYYAFQGGKRNEKQYPYISDYISNRGGDHHAYVVTDYDERQFVVVDGFAGQKYDKIVDPVFSPDGSLLSYRARQEGRRFVVMSDLNGAVVRQHKDYDMVFRPVFSNDGTSIGYGVRVNNELWWKVEKVR